MSNENLSQTEGSQHFSGCNPSDLSWCVADDDDEALALPPVDFGDLLDPFADLPELQTDPAALENAPSVNLGHTCLRQDLLPDAQLHAQMAVSDMQREIRDLRRSIFTLEQRLNVYDCILPRIQQESTLNQSRMSDVEDYTAKFVTWAFEFKTAVEQIALQIGRNMDYIRGTSNDNT